MYLGSVCSWTQGCWVWRIARLMSIWAQHVAEPKNIRYGSSPDLYTLNLSKPKDIEFGTSPDTYVLGFSI